MAIPHNSKCRYGSEVRQLLTKSADNTGCCKGERRQWRKQRAEAGAAVAECDFAPEARCGYRNPTLSSILATQICPPPERCLSRQAGIVRYCPIIKLAANPALNKSLPPSNVPGGAPFHHPPPSPPRGWRRRWGRNSASRRGCARPGIPARFSGGRAPAAGRSSPAWRARPAWVRGRAVCAGQ